MKKMVTLFLCLGLASCVSGGSKSGGSSPDDHPDSTPTAEEETHFGDCTMTGGLSQFEILCSDNIAYAQVIIGNITLKVGREYRSKGAMINGEVYDRWLRLEPGGKAVEGGDNLNMPMSFQIIHEDGSNTNIDIPAL